MDSSLFEFYKKKIPDFLSFNTEKKSLSEQVKSLSGDFGFMRQYRYLCTVFPEHTKDSSTQRRLMKILQVQEIESRWYAGYKRYEDTPDVLSDKSLIEFNKTQTAHGKRYFSFIHLIENKLTRIPNALARRMRILVNHPGRNTMGLKITRCPLPTFRLLNCIAQISAKNIPHQKIKPLLVNSVLRTVKHQMHLATLGYIAPFNSSHINGYAADIEQKWYKENNPIQHEAIQSVLDDFASRQIINCVDYSNLWHICLNPKYISQFSVEYAIDRQQAWEDFE